jgi:4-aminobutyrate aminotransferase-like enzyme
MTHQAAAIRLMFMMMISNVEVLLDEDLPGRARALGQWTMGRLNEMARRHELIGEVRGVGLMIGVELVWCSTARARSRRRPRPPRCGASVVSAAC